MIFNRSPHKDSDANPLARNNYFKDASLWVNLLLKGVLNK